MTTNALFDGPITGAKIQVSGIGNYWPAGTITQIGGAILEFAS